MPLRVDTIPLQRLQFDYSADNAVANDRRRSQPIALSFFKDLIKRPIWPRWSSIDSLIGTPLNGIHTNLLPHKNRSDRAKIQKAEMLIFQSFQALITRF